jgi:hypothetical protein
MDGEFLMFHFRIHFIAVESNSLADLLLRMFTDDQKNKLLGIQLFPLKIASREIAMIAPVVVDDKAEELTNIHNLGTFIHPGIEQLKKICSGMGKIATLAGMEQVVQKCWYCQV